MANEAKRRFFGRRVWLLAALLALLAAVAGAKDYPWLQKSVWWRPYQWTADDFFLLHFDELKAPDDAESRFLQRQDRTTPSDVELNTAPAAEAPGGEETRETVNAIPNGKPGLAAGRCGAVRGRAFRGRTALCRRRRRAAVAGHRHGGWIARSNAG